MERNNSKDRSRPDRLSDNRFHIGTIALIIGLLVIVSWTVTPSTSAGSSAAETGQDGTATIAMLNYALNLRSASGLAVFGGESVSDRGSEIRGQVASTGEVAGVSSEAMSSVDAAQARRDLQDAFSAVDQLPCTNIDGNDLGGRSFGPGVYCLGSAQLAGRMTVDAGGDANARFVFRIGGSFTATDGSGIDLIGSANPLNVYIFSSSAARIGAGATIGSNLISRQEVIVGHGSTVFGKVIGVAGTVSTDGNIIAAGTGFVEICKEIFPNDIILPGTIFSYTVSGVNGTIQVPAGGCSPPIEVAAGPVTVTEDPRPNTAVVGIATTPADRLASSNLPLRQAVVTVPTGDVSTQTVVTFTNQTTRTGTIEICKFAALAVPRSDSTPLGAPADPDVSGFFDFTVQGAPGQIISVPVGFCSGPITVTILQVNSPSPAPTQPFTANVTELAHATYRCENVTTFPVSALNPPIHFNQGFDANGNPIPNTDGCYVNVNLNVGTGPANQTTVRFFNRSLPGRIKICKITADPVNIPIGTQFTFTVSGIGPTSSTQTLPGKNVTENVNVLAGPAAQGGFCAFATNTFIVGSPVTIDEIGVGPLPLPVYPRGTLDSSSSAMATTPADESRERPAVRNFGGNTEVFNNRSNRPAAGPWFVDPAGNDRNTCLAPGPATACLTLQAAINKASSGDTINVAAGTYSVAGVVTVNKTLTISGAQAGVDARGRVATESILQNSGGLFVNADNVTIDGFTIQNSVNTAFTGGGILLGAGTGGAHVVNNIIQNNILGLFLANRSGAAQAVIQHNVFRNNTQTGSANGHGIYADQFTAGIGGVVNVLIDGNNFVNDNGYALGTWGIGMSNTNATPFTGLTISNNKFNSASPASRGLYFYNTDNSSITGNSFRDKTNYAMGFFSDDNNISISCNTMYNSNRGIYVSQDFTNPSSGFVANNNIFSGNTSAGLQIDVTVPASYTGTFDATNNYWNSVTGPTIASNPGGTGDTIVDAGGFVNYSPFLFSPPVCAPIPTADLSLTKTVDVQMPPVGSNVVFTITVSNAGPDQATNVSVTDLLPAGFSYVSYIASQGTYVNGTGLWTVGTLNFPGSATLNITATANASGPFVNTAQVTASDQFDPDSTPNNAMAGEDDQANATPIPTINGLPVATFADVLVSQIQASTPLITPPTSIFDKRAQILARNTTAEVTFTNFLFRPAVLKLCKVAGTGVQAGTPFTFNLAPLDPLTTWPYTTTSVTVPAGSCTFVNGPFPPVPGFSAGANVGTFNYNTAIVVTEVGAGTSVTAITSTNTHGGLIANLGGATATLTLDQALLIDVAPPLGVPDYNVNELSFTNAVSFGPPPHIDARFDFDGDHKSDIVVFRPSDGTWYYSPSSAGGARGVQFGANGDIPMAADYDGDGVTDPAVFRPSTGTWYMLRSTAGFTGLQFGFGTDIPAAADFDGDGRADVAVFRPSTGTWYIMGSTAGFSGVQFGMNGDIPVAADFDGDHRADVAVFRPSTGTWYMLRSTAGFTGVQFGMNGDVPVGADYDGDGRADAAVFRPSNGTWYMLGSTAGFSGVQFGMAVTHLFRPTTTVTDARMSVSIARSDRTWYILNSSQSGNAAGGLSAMQFGANGDMTMRY